MEIHDGTATTRWICCSSQHKLLQRIYAIVSPALDADLIQEPAFRELLAAKGIHQVTLNGRSGGFAVEVAAGDYRRLLGTSRGQLRMFCSLNTATKYLRSFGITRFQVDAAGFKEGRLRGPRPDRAKALRAAQDMRRMP